ncbi:hypothetical protein D9M71_479780 [compost metagenome]
MAGFVGEAGLGQLDAPVGFAHQVVGVAETQAVARLDEVDHLGRGGAVLGHQRVLAGFLQQAHQVVGGGDVEFRQSGRLDIASATHAQGLGLGVHRGDERRVAAPVVVGQGGGGAVLRGHQGDMQEFAAAELAAQAHARVDPFHFPILADGDGEHLVQRLLGLQHHHRDHQLGHRGDGHDPTGIARVDDLVVGKVDQHGAAGRQLQFRRVANRQRHFLCLERSACQHKKAGA